MAKLSYYEKLKDPRWQKKRLEVLSHYEFTCQSCFDDQQTLHVHHKEYFKGREPWEYDLRQLTVLCESCHEATHDSKDVFKFVSSILEIDGPRSRDEAAFFIAGLMGFDYKEVLANSEYEDCAWTALTYDTGLKASKIELSFKKYIAHYEKKNGKNQND
jgi:hypothetical protein